MKVCRRVTPAKSLSWPIQRNQRKAVNSAGIREAVAQIGTWAGFCSGGGPDVSVVKMVFSLDKVVEDNLYKYLTSAN